MDTQISVEKIEQYLELFLEGKRTGLPEMNEEETIMVRTMIESHSSASPSAEFVGSLRAQVLVMGARTVQQSSAPRADKPHFIQEFSMAVKDLFKPRFALVRVGITSLVVVAIIGGALLYPGIKDGFKKTPLSRKEASAQEILTKLASNITSFQESSDVVHRIDRMTGCMQDYGYYGMWYSRSAMPVANENGYFCTTDTNESWSMGDSYLYISKDEQGEITSINLNRNGWTYSYTGGAKKASKTNWNAVNEAVSALSSASAGGYGTMAYQTNAVTTETLKSVDPAEENTTQTQNVQQIQEDTLLKLKELYGNVEVLGQETVNGKETYKLQYVYDQTGMEKFGVAANVFYSADSTITTVSTVGPVSAALNDPNVMGADGLVVSSTGVTTVVTGSAGTSGESGTLVMTTDAAGTGSVSASSGIVGASPGVISLPAPYPSSTTTTFWVDTDTFEQVKFEEWGDVNGVPQLMYRSEVLLQETISPDRADEVFQFTAPAGIEVVDTTQMTLDMQKKSMEANQLSISNIIDTAPVGLFVPAQIPEGLTMGDIFYNDPSIYMNTEFYRDFMPEKAYDEMVSGEMSSEVSLSYSYSAYDYNASAECYVTGPSNQKSLNVRLSEKDPFETGYYQDLASMKENMGDAPDYEVTDKTVDVNGQSGTLRTTTYTYEGSGSSNSISIVFKLGRTYIDVSTYNTDEAETLAIARSMVEVTSADGAQGLALQAAADLQAERWNTPYVPTVPDFRSIAGKASVNYYYPKSLPEGLMLTSSGCYDYNNLSLYYGNGGAVAYSADAVSQTPVAYKSLSINVNSVSRLEQLLEKPQSEVTAAVGTAIEVVSDPGLTPEPVPGTEPYVDPNMTTSTREITVLGQIVTLTLNVYAYPGSPSSTSFNLHVEEGDNSIDLYGDGLTEDEIVAMAQSLTKVEPNDTAVFDQLEQQLKTYNEQVTSSYSKVVPL